MSDGGKGDKQRPGSVPMKVFDNNWDLIFKNPKPKVELGDGENIPPITQEKIDELNTVLDQYET
jgi:hypothetical protein